MLGSLILAMLQFAIGWAATPAVQKYIIVGAQLQPFLNGAIAGIVAWIVGLVGAQVLKDVQTPAPTNLTAAVIGGLIGGAVIVFKLPQMVGLAVPPLAIILALAIAGYHVKR